MGVVLVVSPIGGAWPCRSWYCYSLAEAPATEAQELWLFRFCSDSTSMQWGHPGPWVLGIAFGRSEADFRMLGTLFFCSWSDEASKINRPNRPNRPGWRAQLGSLWFRMTCGSCALLEVRGEKVLGLAFCLVVLQGGECEDGCWLHASARCCFKFTACPALVPSWLLLGGFKSVHVPSCLAYWSYLTPRLGRVETCHQQPATYCYPSPVPFLKHSGWSGPGWGQTDFHQTNAGGLR